MGTFVKFLLVVLIAGQFMEKVFSAAVHTAKRAAGDENPPDAVSKTLTENPPQLLMSTGVEATQLCTVPLNNSTLEPEVDKIKILTSGEFAVMEPKHGTNKIYFASSGSYKIGIYDTSTNTTEYHMPGSGASFTDIAYDWINTNLYVTDPSMQAILVMDDEIRYSKIIYASQAKLGVIAVQPIKRFLFFSSSSSNESSLIRSNLAGEERKTILKIQKNHEIYAITVDFDNDCLYVVHEFTDYYDDYHWMRYVAITRVGFDGSNKTMMHRADTYDNWLRGIVSYKKYIYTGENHHSSAFIKQIGKDHMTSALFNSDGPVRNLVMSAKVSEVSGIQEDSIGSCSDMLTCDHICLAQVNTSRICVCSDGYRKDGDTGCQKLELITDDYMLVSDVGQDKLFQLSMTPNSSNNFYSYEKPFATQWSLVVLDVSGERIFWADKNTKKINVMKTNGTSGRTLATDISARDMVYDPLDENLYVIDDVTQSILVLGATSGHVATVLSLEKKFQDVRTRKKLAVDIEGRYIFWSLTIAGTASQMGEIRRAKLDGTGEELIVEKIVEPDGLDFDQIRHTLFFTTESDYGVLEINAIKFSQSSQGQERIPTLETKRLTEFSDMTVINGRVYISGQSTIHVMNTNLLSNKPGYQKKFVSTRFRKISSIAIFDQQNSEKVLSPLGSTCDVKGCHHLCISTGKNVTKCLCKSGYRLTKLTHCEEHVQTDYPPTYVTCPLDQTLYQNPCSNVTSFTWVAPKWKDDHDAAENLILTSPNLTSPASLKIGVHNFQYTATDSSGNVGLCSFMFTLKKFTADCDFATYTSDPESMTASRECVGAHFFVRLTCLKFAHHTSRARVEFDPKSNVCLPEEDWIFHNYINCNDDSYY